MYGMCEIHLQRWVAGGKGRWKHFDQSKKINSFQVYKTTADYGNY